ncbi:hypothetical protein HRbin17_01318 [bacterium HR17]|uniref:Uncharacterized protein n=1 Tax=Candidatus Fervidibacter japonicus TaxID=2035412 RepID=A0A2H5XC99_9BACT|nr:hypothetical protein HRbin17_01318 [bacterium HR17]
MRRCVFDGGSREPPSEVRRAHLRCADVSLTAAQESRPPRFGGRISDAPMCL